jgi:thioredoxin-related protein
MKRLAIIPILLIAGVMQSYAQTDTSKGISFVHDLSWQQILQMAKSEDKYIFVDCYATWCGPCKWMDKNVYPEDSVGIYMNAHFISVRLQMDTSKRDDDEVQRDYAVAQEIKQKYHIWSYPCYLFFSPDGNAVHKSVGTMDSKGFLSLAGAAMNSKMQYYTILANYRKDEKDSSQGPILLEAARKAGELYVSDEVALEFVQNYLDKLPENMAWTFEKIKLFDLCLECIRCEDRIFEIYYRGRKEIDSALNNLDYADTRINIIIYREKIKPILDNVKKSGEKPDWNRIENEIAKAYGSHYAKINILKGLVEYYNSTKNWHKYVKCFIQLKQVQGIENLQPTTEFNRMVLNNAAYEVFEYGNKEQLIKALSWVDRALSTNSSYFDAIDTKANILYKLGSRQEGIVLEEQARTLVPKSSRSYAGIQDNYKKLKQGLPTWVCE